ncbi:MAG: hypothetical protein IPP82_02390 [Xanthomonadales bacterium]|nr:hypothetical protein [Xanthomonadales bacterium]
MRVKIALLLACGLLISVIGGFQQLSGFSHIPDGNRIVVVGSHIILCICVLGLFSSLFLISKANRNLSSFLKAFNVLGLLMILGQCTTWLDKFNGPEKSITSSNGKYIVDVPSDWAELKEREPNLELQVMDWAGTGSLSIFSGGFVEKGAEGESLIEARETLGARIREKLGEKIGTFSCGTGCVGEIYPIVSHGKDMRLFSAVKLSGLELLVVQGGMMKSLVDSKSEIIKRMIGSARATPPK